MVFGHFYYPERNRHSDSHPLDSLDNNEIINENPKTTFKMIMFFFYFDKRQNTEN